MRFKNKKKETTRHFEEILQLVRQRAENLYENHKLCCSESLLLVMNQSFASGLSSEQAIQLGAGFCGGMGGAGCTCGALSGAIMGIGLLLGPHAKNGLSKKKFRELTKKMHDRFHERFSSTCCRVLIQPFDKDKKGRTQFCGSLTGTAAALAVELLLEARPELINRLQKDYLTRRDSKISGLLQRLT